MLFILVEKGYSHICEYMHLSEMISPFCWCWVEEEGSLDDGGDGVGDEGEDEGGVGGRPGGETPPKPGGSSQQSHSNTNFKVQSFSSGLYDLDSAQQRNSFTNF